MIKKLLHTWFVAMTLAGILVGCSHVPDYDNRLERADSVIYAQIRIKPTAALDSLESISLSSLPDEANRAYHALLITQARYKCYTVITSDSEINSAVKYFSDHQGDHEKLTRSYIYKGAVMEDLSKPDSAMLNYKKAEVCAHEVNDHDNEGYALLRMGKLYAKHNAYDGRDIEKLEDALECFRKSGNTYYQMICLKELGALYRPTNGDKAERSLNEAITLAEKDKDTTNLVNVINNLVYYYFMKSASDKDANKKAYELLQRIKSLKSSGLEYNVYTTFACVYASLGMPDSAEYYLQFATLDKEKDPTLYYEALSRIAIARGNILDYYRYSHYSDSISFGRLFQPDIVNIMYSELSFDTNRAKELEHERHKKSLIIASIVGAIMLSLLLIALLLYRRSHRYDRLIVELKDQSQSQMNDLSGLQENISEMKIKDEQLKGFISSHLDMMREMIEACYHEPNNRIAESMKRIVKFQDSNKDNWIKLYDYIDMEHNNIMTHTRNNYPQLDDRDLLLLALTCMRYSYIQTAIIMGYSNATSVSVLKQRLAKKMGLDYSLNEYIDRYSTTPTDQKQ